MSRRIPAFEAIRVRVIQLGLVPNRVPHQGQPVPGIPERSGPHDELHAPCPAARTRTTPLSVETVLLSS